MARDATARLYDVDEDRLIYKRLRLTNRYDEGQIIFRARKGKMVDLAKLHESIWATRLSGGTNSGVICLQVTAVGKAVPRGEEVVFHISGSAASFRLVENVRAKPVDAEVSSLKALRKTLARGGSEFRITGYVAGWAGRWPGVLKKRPPSRPDLMVIRFSAYKASPGKRLQGPDERGNTGEQ